MIPYIPLTLNDKTYNLRFGMGAMVEFEQLSGKKVTQLGNEIGVETMAQLLFVMIRRENKNLTMEQVMNMIDDNADNIQDVLDIVGKAIETAFGKSPNVKAPKQK